MISRTSREASSSAGDSNSSRVASPRHAGPPSALAVPEATSSASASGAPFSIDGIHRWWAIGCALTNPAAGDSSRSVTTAWASRRPPADRVPAKVPPGPIRGAARPEGGGRGLGKRAVFWGKPRAGAGGGGGAGPPQDERQAGETP